MHSEQRGRRASSPVRSRASFLALVLFGSSALSPPGVRAQACACESGAGAEPSAREARPDARARGADAIFEGRVVEVVVEGDARRVTLEVVQQWRGTEAERVSVLTPARDCGVPFIAETSWLVFARLEPAGLATDRCLGTGRIEEASDRLASLGAGVVPVVLTDRDEVEAPTARPRPARAGFASCAVSASPGHLEGSRGGVDERAVVGLDLASGLSSALALAALLARRRVRRRQLL